MRSWRRRCRGRATPSIILACVESCALVRKTQNRNDELNGLGYALREFIARGVLAYDDAAGLLLEACRLNGYLAKDGLREVMGTIRSALGEKPEETNEPSFFKEEGAGE
jgi:hypothetical protein